MGSNNAPQACARQALKRLSLTVQTVPNQTAQPACMTQPTKWYKAPALRKQAQHSRHTNCAQRRAALQRNNCTVNMTLLHRTRPYAQLRLAVLQTVWRNPICQQREVRQLMRLHQPPTQGDHNTKQSALTMTPIQARQPTSTVKHAENTSQATHNLGDQQSACNKQPGMSADSCARLPTLLNS